MQRYGRFTLCAVFALLLLAGCDSQDGEQQAPAVLPAEAFSLQTSLFNQDGAAKTTAGTHFVAAALRVWPVSVILSANLVIPVAVTAAALQDEPDLVDGSWVWTSTAVADGEEVTFTLTATPQGGTIHWSMRISYVEARSGRRVEDFELYTAQTDLDSRTGSWQLYYRIDEASRNVLHADFTAPGDTEVTITYSVPETAERNAGDSVRYDRDGDDYAFLWRQVEEQLEHLVTWNAVTHAGSITATNYNDGQSACWDEALENADCAPQRRGVRTLTR